MSAVYTLVGVVLLNDVQQAHSRHGLSAGRFVKAPTFPAEQVETVDVLVLIAAHQAEKKNGRFLPPLHA